MEKTFYVYIMTNKLNSVLYTGMTGRSDERAFEHQQKLNKKSFTVRYNINKVVFAEAFVTPIEAAEAERRIKGWTRKKKIALIESVNPTWEDLSGRDASLRSAIRIPERSEGSQNPKRNGPSPYVRKQKSVPTEILR